MKRSTVGKALYALLFNAALPAALVLWAWGAREQVTIAGFLAPTLGGALILLGALLVVAGMASLFIHGQGLPMNPWPPARLVSEGVYALLSHPIYVGAVLVCGGVSLVTGSAAGLWLVTPTLALASMALVLGYEAPDLERRLGPRTRAAWIGLPLDQDVSASRGERGGALVAMAIPLTLLGAAVRALNFDRGAPRDVHVAVWILPLMLMAAAVIPAKRGDLRRLVLRAWLGTALIAFVFLVCPREPLFGEALAGEDGPLGIRLTGLVSTLGLAGFLGVPVLFRGRGGRIALALGIALAVLLDGPPLNLALAAIAATFGVVAPRLWELCRRGAERLAGSWQEVRVGKVRIINHGALAAVGCGVGVYYATVLVGEAHAWALLGAALAAVVGSAIWAQLIEGSPALARPYGFFGGLLAIVAWALASPLHHAPAWLLLGAFCVAGPMIQGLGRLRCIANGCCHGAPAAAWVGITYRHPMTRPVRLASLGGVPIHPTQLYSLFSNAVIGTLLLRLWLGQASASLIAGVYLVLMGLTRFVEEALRGEPQTPTYAGLRLYQWVSIVCVVAGAVVTCIDDTPPAPELDPSMTGFTVAVLFAAVTWLVASVDFPESRSRFARLA